MKQLLSLFLLLLPCLSWAQYPSNGNQKITLGEQTTADGIIWRGVSSDTTLTTKSDTAAYFVLDTVNKKLYFYKASAIPKWNEISGSGGSTLDTATMLLPYYRSGRTGIIQASDVPTLNQNTTGSAATLTTSRTFQTNLASTSTASFNGSANVTPGVTGTLAVANGGTGATTFTSGRVLLGNGTSAINTSSNLFYDVTNNRLGIGTASPGGKLTVSSAGGADNGINLITTSGNSYAPIDFNTPTGLLGQFLATGASFVNGGFGGDELVLAAETSTAALHLAAIGASGYIKFTTGNLLAANERMRITSSGNVGIGTTSPLALLNVMGTVRINSASAPDANYYLQLENSISQKAKAHTWDTYSDSRIKTNRQPIINAIDKIKLLNPLYYNQHDSYVENDLLNIDYNNSYKSLGFIAQEVYEVIPEAVNMGTTNELWAMDYTKLIPILTKAIQEQNSLIKALEQRIINLENK
jgi:uncharacterized protein YqkB